MGTYFFAILTFFSFSFINAANYIDPLLYCIFERPVNISYDSNKIKFEFEPQFLNSSSGQNISIKIIHKGEEERTAFCNIIEKKISCEYISDIPYYGRIILNNYSILYPCVNYIITQNISLKYKRAYFANSIDYFFIEVEESTLPNGAFTDLNIYTDERFSHDEYPVVNCIYNDLFLNCSAPSLRLNPLIKLTQEKNPGSVNWINSIDEKLILYPISYFGFWPSYSAEYVENKWTFFMFYPEIYHKTPPPNDCYYYYRGIVLMKQNGTKIFAISKCFTNTSSYKCIVESDNQEQNDFIYKKYSGDFNKQDQFAVIMNLTYKKAYRLYGNETFHIEVEETSYRNGAKVIIGCLKSIAGPGRALQNVTEVWIVIIMIQF